MKANELMIGDLVMSYDVPLRVAGLSRKSTKYDPIYVEKVNHSDPKVLSDEYWTTESEIFGIPLTAEVLEMNGWKEADENLTHGKYVFIHGEKGIITLLHWTNFYSIHIADVEMKISYIHELQHILRLYGLTELADNLKTK